MSEKEQQTRDQQGQESAETQIAQQTEPVEHVEQPREPSQVQAGSMIADLLGESEEFPRQQIITMVQALGRTQARALLERALEIEANGGLCVDIWAGTPMLCSRLFSCLSEECMG